MDGPWIRANCRCVWADFRSLMWHNVPHSHQFYLNSCSNIKWLNVRERGRERQRQREPAPTKQPWALLQITWICFDKSHVFHLAKLSPVSPEQWARFTSPGGSVGAQHIFFLKVLSPLWAKGAALHKLWFSLLCWVSGGISLRRLLR